MPRPNMTVDEWVATLSHLDFPTLLVEGDDDMRIYRWLEEGASNQKVDVQSVGGRKTLLSVYERRDEFADLPVAFLADRDLWLFSGIPPNYPDIIWTHGYSIENDLYGGADLEKLLDAHEVDQHRQLLDTIIKWFAFEVDEHLKGRDAHVNIHIDRVVPPGRTELDRDFCTCRGFRLPNEELYQEIKDEYQFKLRGKSLFEVLVRFLNAPGRRSKHNTIPLHEIALKMTPVHGLMNRLLREIERTIAEHTPANR